MRFLVLPLLATTALAGTLALPAMGQTPPSPTQPTSQSQAQPTQLDAITTAATRTKRPIEDVPGTVSVITTEDIERDNLQDMRDVVRNAPGRAGLTNFVIRGIGGNRVVVMTDGVRVPDSPGSNTGSPTGYTRDVAFNITNARYWNSQDVIGVAANSDQLDRYAQPGRYFSANLTMKW